MRLLVLGAAALLLSGCAAIPPAVSIASLALDGASWAVSGKTMSDHALSEVAGADCRLIGILEDGRVCRETPTYEETQVATLQPLPESGTRLAAAPAPGEGEGAPEATGGDPVLLPPELSYLSDALADRGLAEHPSASGVPVPVAMGFAPLRGARGFTGQAVAASDPLGGLRYAAAGLGVVD